MAISVKKAVEGFNLHLLAEGLSPHTIRDYNLTLRRFQEFIGPLTPLDCIVPDQVRQFLAYWQGATVAPAGVAPRPARKLSSKTILNMHTALSSLWSWAVREGFAEEHVLSGRIKPPRAEPPPIEPLDNDQIHALMSACRKSERNTAVMLFLLDTGCRASEVCGLRVADLDLKRGSAMIENGKGGKKRVVGFGPKTGRALFRYLAGRGEIGDHAPVFAARGGGALSRRGLLGVVQRAGKRAGINGVYPHLLRHTFAINYLRFGGDIYTLQKMLGHSSLDMVKRYLKIAGADVLRVHRRASPVENIL